MANPWSITWGDFTVGGSSESYLLHDPYVIDKSFDRLRLVFNVVVVAESYADLHEKCDAVEAAFILRDKTLTIDLDGTQWEYTNGSGLFNPVSTIQKSGDPEVDRGYSRAYTVVIEGEIPPPESGSPLIDLQVQTEYAAGRRKSVLMTGLYFRSGGSSASENYLSDFDDEATTLLTAIGSDVTWELTAESFTQDRTNARAQFMRRYDELLVDQSTGSLDDPEIRDHKFTFTAIDSYPGDALEGVNKLSRVVGRYECSIDIDQTTDVQAVYESKVRDTVLGVFETNFSPSEFAVEDSTVNYDETDKRLSVSLQFVYRAEGNAPTSGGAGADVVEVAMSVAYREVRTIDYTPTHSGGELEAVADPGWASLERVWRRTVTVVGGESPKRRLGQAPSPGKAGRFDHVVANQDGPDGRNLDKVQKSGWNIVANTSDVSERWIGDPSYSQMLLSTLTEEVVERYHEAPSGGGAAAPTAPTTQGVS